MYTSVILRTFTLLCYHHYYPSINLFMLQNWNSVPLNNNSPFFPSPCPRQPPFYFYLCGNLCWALWSLCFGWLECSVSPPSAKFQNFSSFTSLVILCLVLWSYILLTLILVFNKNSRGLHFRLLELFLRSSFLSGT